MEDKIEILTLEEITEKYYPTSYNTWDEWFSEKDNIYCNDRVDRLKEEYLKNGKFDDPIVFLEEENDSGLSNERYIIDGMHRLKVLKELGVKTVELIDDKYLQNEPESTELLVIELGLNDEAWEDLGFCLTELSWRHKGSKSQPWLTIIGGSGYTIEVEGKDFNHFMSYYFSDLKRSEVVLSELFDDIFYLVQDYPYFREGSVKILSLSWITLDDDDNDVILERIENNINNE